MDTVTVVFPLDQPVRPAGPAQCKPRGAAAEAIAEAETALARQNSVAAQVDLQVVSAVLNAHAAHAEGAGALEELQCEISAAVTTRTDLDTPAGAREFQRYLLDKLNDIRGVVEDAGLDDTSKASLAASLASLYASSGAAVADDGASADRPAPPAGTPLPPRPAGSAGNGPVDSAPAGASAPVDLGLDGIGDPGEFGPAPGEFGSAPAEFGPAPAAPAPSPAMPAMPAWGGGLPSAGGLPNLPGLSDLSALPEPAGDQAPAGADADSEPEPQPVPESPADAGDSGTDIAGVIAAAVSGTPIPEAFAAQGITIPPAGTAVDAPLEPFRVSAGDIGILTDRHALALGNGKALLDNQIQPIETVNRPGFLGWQHPPAPEPREQPESPHHAADPGGRR